MKEKIVNIKQKLSLASRSATNKLRLGRPNLSRVKESRIFAGIGAVLARTNTTKAIRLLIVLVFVVAVIEVVFAVLIYGYHKDDRFTRLAARFIPYPAVVYNHKVITYSQYLAERDYIYHFYKATEQENVSLAEIDKQILDHLAENSLLEFQAWRLGVKVANEEVNQTVDAIVDQNGGQEKVEKVLQDLYGLDLRSFRRLVKNQVLREKINNEVIARVTVRHILIRVNREDPEDKVNEAKAKIDGLLGEIKNGADFAEVAEKNSEDIGSNEQGGEIEPFAKDEMVTEFSDTAFATPVGEISEPIRSDFGWHIIKVESKTGKVEQRFTDWLDEMKSGAFILKLV
ncbi:MAG: peptidylprolyl isomerase [Patescibacteria group bacterium]